jgi:hypothetical protein
MLGSGIDGSGSVGSGISVGSGMIGRGVGVGVGRGVGVGVGRGVAAGPDTVIVTVTVFDQANPSHAR